MDELLFSVKYFPRRDSSLVLLSPDDGHFGTFDIEEIGFFFPFVWAAGRFVARSAPTASPFLGNEFLKDLSFSEATFDPFHLRSSLGLFPLGRRTFQGKRRKADIPSRNVLPRRDMIRISGSRPSERTSVLPPLYWYRLCDPF